MEARGYAIITDPDARAGVAAEWDTITCIHCQRIIRVKAGTASTVYLLWKPAENRWVEEPGAMCALCNRPVCLHCHDLGACPGPWEKQMEVLERIERARRW